MSTIFEKLWSEALGLGRGWLSFDRHTHEVNLHGLKTGKVTAQRADRVPGFGVVVTLHEAGSKHWAMRGAQSYSGATTYTVLVQGELERDRYRYVQLTRPVEVKGNDADRAEASQATERTLERFRIEGAL